jgi:hypothetical protein
MAKGSFGVSFDTDLSPLIKGVAKMDDRLDRAVAATVLRQSHIATGWMRENAPWTDRTGNARAGLDTTTDHEPKVHHTIWLFGRMPYQVWLEVRFAGKYAIIGPAIVDQGKKLMKTFTKLLDRLNGGLTQG